MRKLDKHRPVCALAELGANNYWLNLVVVNSGVLQKLLLRKRFRGMLRYLKRSTDSINSTIPVSNPHLNNYWRDCDDSAVFIFSDISVLLS